MCQKRVLSSLAALLAACATLAGEGASAGEASPRVTGLPGKPSAEEALPPYEGSFPTEIARPSDPFPFPIHLGETGPAEALFAGPRQYPFICDTIKSGLGPPLADNHDGIGTFTEPALDTPETRRLSPAGFSRDCLAPTRAWHLYKRKGSTRFVPWWEGAPDAEEITIGGERLPFVLRVEMGTINRFIYVIAALRGSDEHLDTPRADRWNRRLIYQFYGGVGIGHRQGQASVRRVLRDREAQLAQGYGVIASTGTTTANHFDIALIEDTALRVKRQFTALYGTPEYTVGVGGSGGAIQQYLLAQNRPGLIDAAIAQYSYPDMITQTIPVFDCELLEHYFDVTDGENPAWQDAAQRRAVGGFNASNSYTPNERVTHIQNATRLSYLVRGEWGPTFDVVSECTAGWRGLTPLVLNPRYASFEERLSPTIYRLGKWSHFENLRQVFGTDAEGYARIPWDNVGVQYGLLALRAGRISPAEFLRLNARIGSWQSPARMRPEQFWLIPGGHSELRDFSPWSAHNMNLARNERGVAPRFRGDLDAIRAAYRSGQVFLGRLDIPVIDLRPYLDPVLDMHHAAGSFSVRARIKAARDDTGKQALWISDPGHDATPLAFAAIDAWLAAKRENRSLSWREARPASALDRCFAADGRVIAVGDDVWDGDWNGRSAGACMRTNPIHGNPRIMAGDSIAGDLFKCALQPIGAAIASGLYAPIDMQPYRKRLEEVFPEGVCDFARGDAGRPSELAP